MGRQKGEIARNELGDYAAILIWEGQTTYQHKVIRMNRGKRGMFSIMLETEPFQASTVEAAYLHFQGEWDYYRASCVPGMGMDDVITPHTHGRACVSLTK